MQREHARNDNDDRQPPPRCFPPRECAALKPRAIPTIEARNGRAHDDPSAQSASEFCLLRNTIGRSSSRFGRRANATA